MKDQPKVKMFVEGRYRKLSRDLPQTVFYCPECKGHPRRRRKCEKCEGFGKLSRDSAQELIGWVLGKATGTRKHKFHGAGREDVDVRMLGMGRPFIMEIIDPRIPDPDLADVEAQVNSRNEGRLEIHGLHWTEKGRVRVIKETASAKAYRAWVEIEGEPDLAAFEQFKGKRQVLAQKTPERVAHRRADLTRERWIELKGMTPALEWQAAGNDPLWSGEEEPQAGQYVVDLVTQHGTYVKEFISGEDGKTDPALGESLGGVTCRCLRLDVMEILGEDGETPAAPRPRPQTNAFGMGL